MPLHSYALQYIHISLQFRDVFLTLNHHLDQVKGHPAFKTFPLFRKVTKWESYINTYIIYIYIGTYMCRKH
jgi:hypothetical protein